MSLYVQPFQALSTAPPAAPAPAEGPREVTGWMLRHPDSLDADEQHKLRQVLAAARTWTPP